MPQTTCHANRKQAIENRSGIEFDLPRVLAASEMPGKKNCVLVTFRLSAVIHPEEESASRHWRLIAQPRGSSTTIIDYEPKTETVSETVGSVENKTSEERSRTLGFGGSLDYAKMATIHSTGEQSTKETHSYQFQSKGPRQTKIASSTINRGRGIHFKLARTSQQVLDGEKSFHLILEVPDTWRSGLFDLTVMATGTEKRFDWRSAQWKTRFCELRVQSFVIAIYREGDSNAKKLAFQFAEQEQTLRSLAHSSKNGFWHPQLNKFLNDICKAIGCDCFSQSVSTWITQVLNQDFDPRSDHKFNALPADIRQAISDYLKHKNHFLSLNSSTSNPQLETTKRETLPKLTALSVQEGNH